MPPNFVGCVRTKTDDDFQKLDFVLCKKETDVIQDNIQYKIVEEFRIVQMSNFSAFELFSLNFNATKCLEKYITKKNYLNYIVRRIYLMKRL